MANLHICFLLLASEVIPATRRKNQKILLRTVMMVKPEKKGKITKLLMQSRISIVVRPLSSDQRC
ncbi:MAG: hypothetical protein MUD02_01035 [Bacteroidales bacterium]|nr:hypothetical protein [Bacteroidales bacterium]